MHALTILHRCVAPLLVGIHARRLAALLEAVAATVSGPRLTLTEIGRRLGWRWVGRVRGRDDIKIKHRWRSCKRVFAEATETPTALGIGEWVRSNPLRAAFVPVHQPKQGRRAKTTSGKRARSKKRLQAARNAREPRLLVASTCFAD